MQVPATVNVVVAGNGGTTGVGGIVGNGGVVCMADPYAGGNFIITGVVSVIDWTLWGDLSRTQAANPPTAPTQYLAGNNFTLSIESYNKSYRPGFEQANPFIARSKGRVRINYTQGACNNYTEFDVLKTWTTPNPQIVGSTCWTYSTQYVYAVDIASGDNVLDAIGFDQYYWQVTDANGAVVPSITISNNSAETSSIVLTTPIQATFNALVAPFTVKCCFGQCNPWDGGTIDFPTTTAFMNARTSCVTKTIQVLPTTPTFTTPLPPCVATNAASFTGTVSSGGYACTWTSSNPSWTLTPSGLNNQTITVTTLGANPGVLTLTMVGTCGTIINTYSVNRTFAGIALSASSTCALAGSTVTVNLPANAQNNQTCWSGPAGWTFTNGNAAASIRTYTIPAGTPAGCYTITAASCLCPGNISVVVAVKPATPVWNPAPTTCITFGSTAPITYTVNPVPGATGYTWTKPAGWGGTSTTNTITLTPNGTNVGTVTVVANGCTAPVCNSTALSATLLFNPIAPVVNQPLCFNVGVAGSSIFNVTNAQAGSTYTWTFPAAFSSGGGTTGVSVTRTTTGTPGTYGCSVTNTNACGMVTTNFTVTVSFGTTVVSAFEQAGSTLVSTNLIGQTSYTLYNCNTSTNVLTQPGAVFTLSGSNTPGSYTITILTTNGCLVRPPCVNTLWSAMVLDGGGGIRLTSLDKRTVAGSGTDQLVVSPNPNTGTFSLQVDRYFIAGTATIYDAKGAAVGSMVQLNPGRNELGSMDLAPGAYTLSIELDGELQTKTVVVSQK